MIPDSVATMAAAMGYPIRSAIVSLMLEAELAVTSWSSSTMAGTTAVLAGRNRRPMVATAKATA